MRASNPGSPSDAPCPGIGEAASLLVTGSFRWGSGWVEGLFFRLTRAISGRKRSKQAEIGFAHLLKILGNLPAATISLPAHGDVR